MLSALLEAGPVSPQFSQACSKTMHILLETQLTSMMLQCGSCIQEDACGPWGGG